MHIFTIHLERMCHAKSKGGAGKHIRGGNNAQSSNYIADVVGQCHLCVLLIHLKQDSSTVIGMQTLSKLSSRMDTIRKFNTVH